MIGHLSQNCPILIGPTDTLRSYIGLPCVFCLNRPTLLKVVSHYDFSVLSMSVIGLNKCEWGWGGGGVGGLVKLGRSNFSIIIRRCDIGVV